MQRHRPRVAEQVPVAVLQSAAEPLAGRQPRAHLDVLRAALHHVDDDRLVGLGDVRVVEAHRDVREDPERRDALLGLADVAGRVGLAHGEGHAPPDDALAGHVEAVDRDRPHDHLVALAHLEAHARAAVVGRRLEGGLDADIVVAELLVPIDDAAARVLELRGARRLAQRDLRGGGHLLLAQALHPGEGDVPQRRARAELHRDHELDLGRALHPARRIGMAGERRVERLGRQRQPLRVVRARLRGARRQRQRRAPARRRPRARTAPARPGRARPGRGGSPRCDRAPARARWPSRRCRPRRCRRAAGRSGRGASSSRPGRARPRRGRRAGRGSREGRSRGGPPRGSCRSRSRCPRGTWGRRRRGS